MELPQLPITNRRDRKFPGQAAGDVPLWAPCQRPHRTAHTRRLRSPCGQWWAGRKET